MDTVSNCLGGLFNISYDLFTLILSVLDVVTDIIVAKQFYEAGSSFVLNRCIYIYIYILIYPLPLPFFCSFFFLIHPRAYMYLSNI